jgi:hypothetical protein
MTVGPRKQPALPGGHSNVGYAQGTVIRRPLGEPVNSTLERRPRIAHDRPARAGIRYPRMRARKSTANLLVLVNSGL